MEIINLNMGIGILGTKSTYRDGSFLAKFIPPVYIIVEDDLAKSVIECLWEKDEYVAIKYIYSGSWINQMSCLYGFFTYGIELNNSYKVPSFNVLAISDGDIAENAIKKRLNGVIKGDHHNNVQKEIKDMIADSVIAFNLELEDDSINGLPEYNHKHWLEEISIDKIDSINKGADWPFLKEKREVSTLLEVIEYSKSLPNDDFPLKNKNGKFDYHSFYDALSHFSPRNTDHKMNNIQWYILKVIKEYNKEKWSFYTLQVREKILAISESNRNKFSESDFDFR